jgi:hypothetical protein
MNGINKLDVGKPAEFQKRRGQKPHPPGVFNPGLEEALALAGSIEAVAGRAGISKGAVELARARGATPTVVLAIWQGLGVKLSRLLGRRCSCPHCHREI